MQGSGSKAGMAAGPRKGKYLEREKNNFMKGIFDLLKSSLVSCFHHGYYHPLFYNNISWVDISLTLRGGSLTNY